MIDFLFSQNFYIWVLLPVLIFLSKILDVTFGTMKIIFISKGIKGLASLFGTIEVFIWIIAIGQVMQNLTNPFLYIVYALGFGVGTLIGMTIEEKISVGTVLIRIITGEDAGQILTDLSSAKFPVTSMGAEGPEGEVKLILVVVKRQQAYRVIDIVKHYNQNAFYSIEDVRYAKEAEEEIKAPSNLKTKFNHLFYFYKKGK